MVKIGHRLSAPKTLLSEFADMALASPASAYRADVDGLRAIAVTAVVAFHAFPDYFPGGFVGVDIFFVISGYLISGIIFKSLKAENFSFATFYARRIRRIFPALILVILATWIVGWFVLLPDAYKKLGFDIAGGALFVSNIVLWQDAGYFATAAKFKPLLHLWSLGVEEQFYIFWPPILFLAWKRRASTFAIIVFLGLASFVFNIVQASTHPLAAFYLPMSRVWELMLGACLAHIEGGALSSSLARYGRDIERVLRNLMAWGGLCMIVIAVAFINGTMKYPGWWALLPTLGAFFLIAAGNAAQVNRMMSVGPVVFIGLISYPLYLWHWPILSFLSNAYDGAVDFRLRAGAIAAAVILAWLTFRFVEIPIRSGPFSARRVAALVAPMAGLLFLGVGTIQSDGFLVRLPSELRTVAGYKFDFMRAYRSGTCHLEPDQGVELFTPDCSGSTDAGSRPLYILWGDSHASALYQAFNNKEKLYGYSIGQFTSSSCPPYLDYNASNRPPCRPINAFILQKIIALRPAVVILHGSWGFYGDDANRAHFPSTVKALREVGVKRIVLVGPVPIWNPSLPKAVIADYFDHAPHRFATRLTNVATGAVRQTDRNMRRIAAENNIEYFSAFDAFCNDDGCLTTIDSKPVAWDSAHLTDAGAQFVVDKLLSTMNLPRQK